MPPATSSELYASAQLLGAACKSENRAYLLCKQNTPNPKACLSEGSAVTGCGDALIAKLKAAHTPEFEAFRSCLASTNNAFDKCKAQKDALHASVAAAAAK